MFYFLLLATLIFVLFKYFKFRQDQKWLKKHLEAGAGLIKH